jgi:phosphatidylinositol alpha-1,6-mannosyltransferase
MKILIVTFEFVPFAGGIATYTHAIADGLAALGWEVRVLAPHYHGCATLDRDSVFEVVRMHVGHGSRELMRFVPGVSHVNRQLRAFEPDIVLLTSDLAHGIGAISCRWRKVPFAAVVHGSEIAKHFPPTTAKHFLQRLWLKSCYAKANAVFCVSHFVKDLMLHAGFESKKLFVIHNGIDDALLGTPPSVEKQQEIRRVLNVVGKPVVLTLGRVVTRKGQAEVIKAMPAIRLRRPDVCYVIVGKGDDEHRLRALASDLEVEDAVIFAGEVPDDEKLHYLDLCAVYVQPSRRDATGVEGLGIALLEAAARGKPLIGARHGGIDEIVIDEVNGYLIEPAESGELADRIVTLLDNPNMARRMGAAAQQTIVDGFLSSRMAAQCSRHLESLVASARQKAILDDRRFR